MLLPLSLFVAANPLSAPQLWAMGYADGERIPLGGDINGDGFADIISVNPAGTGSVDFSPTIEGQKAGFGSQVFANFGEGCIAAFCKDFVDGGAAEVVLVLRDGSVKLLSEFRDGKFQAMQQIGKLDAPPKPVAGLLGARDGEMGIAVVSATTGEGTGIRIHRDKSADVSPLKLRAELRWFQQADLTPDEGLEWAFVSVRNDLIITAANNTRKALGEAKIERGSNPCVVRDGIVCGAKLWTAAGVQPVSQLQAESPDFATASADFDKDGLEDLLMFRRTAVRHTGSDVYLLYSQPQNPSDSDHDGLSDAEEARIGSNPNLRDSDGDGLLDGWEMSSYRDLDFKALGCSPTHIDLVCYVQRVEDVDEKHVLTELEKVRATFASLDYTNLDRSPGFSFHPIMLPALTKQQADGKPWWELGGANLPAKHRGLARYITISNGGGGQAQQLGDMGGCGSSALWAVFMHEFCHELGLDHSGFFAPQMCPIYPSYMNYAYSYGFNDDYAQIHLSSGKLSSLALYEENLDETLPFPISEVAFLSKGPYRFRLQESGDKTLIDWNWNGVFGEKSVRADINYGYSTHCGIRQTIAKSHSAPSLCEHNKHMFIAYAENIAEQPEDRSRTVSPNSPGRLCLQEYLGAEKWSAPVKFDLDVRGDPILVSHDGALIAVIPTSSGVIAVTFTRKDKTLVQGSSTKISDATTVSVAAVSTGRELFLFLTNTTDNSVSVLRRSRRGFDPPIKLPQPSVLPVGVCYDPNSKQIIVAAAENQTTEKPKRWQVRWYSHNEGELKLEKFEWVGGEAGTARGDGRLNIIFDRSKSAGPDGRVYLYALGTFASSSSPWSNAYVAHQIADKTVGGGWLVKRLYDEWTSSRSAPSVAWFGNELFYSYRWVDGGFGPSDNDLQVAYNGLGIDKEPMSDFDDIRFLADVGIQRGILWMFP